MSRNNPQSARRWVGELLLEIVLVTIGERLLSPALDLVSGTLAREIPTSSTIVYGTIGLVAIVAAAILGVFLLQRLYRWVRTARPAIREMKPPAATVPTASEIEDERAFDLYRTRDSPDIETLLQDARSESTIWVMGIDCSYWLKTYPQKVREAVRDRDLSFVFLIGKEGSSDIKRAAEAGLISWASDAGIEGSKSEFRKLRDDLGEKSHKVRIGICDLPPAHSMVVINPDNPETEVIQVTHYLYETDPAQRPIMLLRRALLTTRQQTVFDQYHKSIEHVLRHKGTKDLDGNHLVV